LKAGLINEKAAKQAKKDKSKQAKVQRKSSGPVIDETKERAKQAMKDKAEHDRELNAQREAERQQKAIQAQIKQLILTNRIRRDGDIAYNFTDSTKIKKIYVSQTIHNQLSWGQIAIVKLNDGYELIPSKAAEKIAARDAAVLIALAAKNEEIADDDPYADYQIPDDLMW